MKAPRYYSEQVWHNSPCLLTAGVPLYYVSLTMCVTLIVLMIKNPSYIKMAQIYLKSFCV